MRKIFFILLVVNCNFINSQTSSFIDYFPKVNTPFLLESNTFIDSFYEKGLNPIPYSIWSKALFCTSQDYNSIIINDSTEFDIVPVGFYLLDENSFDKALVFYFISKTQGYDLTVLYIAVFNSDQDCLFLSTLGENNIPSEFIFVDKKMVLGIGCNMNSLKQSYLLNYDPMIKEFRLTNLSELSID